MLLVRAYSNTSYKSGCVLYFVCNFRYRDAGAEVIEVLSRFCRCVERASIDEAYLDLTEEVEEKLRAGEAVTSSDLRHTHVVGWEAKDENIDKGNQKYQPGLCSSNSILCNWI